MNEMPFTPSIVAGEHVLRENFGFDDFIAAGFAPWLIVRIGDRLEAMPPGEPRLPADARDVPRLDSSGLFPNGMGGPNDNSEWFRPEFALFTEPDPAFSFAVNQTGEPDEDGGPFNRATLTLSLRTVIPANLVELTRANPNLVLRQAPDLSIGLTLTVPVKNDDGLTEIRSVPGHATMEDDGEFVATFTLTGPVVEAAYVHLTHRGEAALEITATYTGYQTTLISFPDAGSPDNSRVFRGLRYEVFGDGISMGPFMPVNPTNGSYRFFLVKACFPRTVPLGLAFDTDTYRSRFTITADGMTRPIIDANDLNQFAGPRSEYRELTTLGNVAAKYPSLRRLYFGQVSGTVVAVPAAYGILRTAQGLRATCDSIVDDSPVTVTGCRFHFTFTVFPMADPVDLARLRADISAIPEAVGRTLRVTLPTGLDPRNPSSLDGFPAAKAVFTAGQGSAVQVGIDIADDKPTPATTNVNLFLQQLGSTGPAPLFGTIAIRLDDDFPQPVHTQMLLNLRQTAGSDELEISILTAEDIQNVQATNQGPHDLVLDRMAGVLGTQVTVTPLGDQVLAAGTSTTLPGTSLTEAVEVSRDLVVPAPLPKAAMLKFVTFNTHTVQQVQHPLTVNAAGLNFGAAGITAIDVQIAMTANPGTPVPAITLSPSHPIDFVHVLVPIDSAVTGLDSTVALTLTTTAGPRTVTVSHDFVDEPILIITRAMIT